MHRKAYLLFYGAHFGQFSQIIVVEFVVLHTLHNKSKQVGLGRRMVCDIMLSARFLISDMSTTTDTATDDIESINNQHSTCTETEAAVDLRGCT